MITPTTFLRARVPQLSRRSALTSALVSLAAAGVAVARTSDAAAPAAPTYRPLPVTDDPVLHAVRRLSFGATPQLVDHVRAIGVSAWLDEQLGSMPDLHGTVVGAGPALPLPEVVAAAVASVAHRDAVQDLQVATFARAAWGDHQVYELVVEFWSNHLSIAAQLPYVRDHKAVDDRDVVRAHALGTFADLLTASVQSPAMLRYLSNAESRGSHPNENYARELLELHTVGVHAGYTQRDVRDAARVLTGLTVDARTGLFSYRPEWHATGAVRVLDWTSPNADPDKGLDVALSLVRYLAFHPATAHHLATKLVRRLVSDTPSVALVASAARVYLEGGTAIVPVLRHIVGSAEFAGSAGQKTQRPFEWFTAAVRALGLQPAPTLPVAGGGIASSLQQLGQAPFGWPAPDGYPDTAAAWASTASTLSRWNAAQALVQGAVRGIGPLDGDTLVGTPLPATAGALVDRLAGKLIGPVPRRALRAAVLQGVSMPAGQAVDQATIGALTPQIAALLLSSPEAQVR
ncbi:MAG: hypothetical protein JWM02_2088 [Frankiales bacterium]|nr:hypothetical protein [Frankiales bacterium]